MRNAKRNLVAVVVGGLALTSIGVTSAFAKADPVEVPCTLDGTALACTLPLAASTVTVTETLPATTQTVTVTATPSVSSTSPSPSPSSSPPVSVSSSTTAAPAGPSGVALPVGNLPGWTQVMTDDFTAPLSSGKWFTPGYSGEIPSAPGAYWAGSQVKVRDGKLILETANLAGRWTSGGIMARQALTYGKILIRTRIDKAAGVKYAHLLWPQSPDTWYTGGEIDFAEDGGGNRTGTTGTVIWFANQTANSKNQIQKSATADFSQWHTLGVEWSPGKLVYTLDGAAFGTVENATAVPDGSMRMALQTEALLTCSQWNTCVGAATPALTVAEFDWVAIYTRG